MPFKKPFLPKERNSLYSAFSDITRILTENKVMKPIPDGFFEPVFQCSTHIRFAWFSPTVSGPSGYASGPSAPVADLLFSRPFHPEIEKSILQCISTEKTAIWKNRPTRSTSRDWQEMAEAQEIRSMLFLPLSGTFGINGLLSFSADQPDYFQRIGPDSFMPFSHLLSIALQKGDEPEASRVRFLKTVLDAIPNPVFLSGPDGRILDCNNSFWEFMKSGRDEWIGKDFKTIISPETAEHYLRHQQRPGSIQRPFRKETSIPLPDGTLHNVLMQIAPWGPSEDKSGLIGSFVDLTDRTQSEKRIRESEEKYRRMIQYAPDGIFIMDPDSLMILEGNPIFADMIGVHFKEALIGIHATTFISRTEEELRESVAKLRLQEGHLLNSRSLYRRKTGAEIHVSANATLIPYGGRDAVLVQVRNISSDVEKEGINRILHELDRMILQGKPLEALLELVLTEVLELYSFFSVHFCTPFPDGSIKILKSVAKSRLFLEKISSSEHLLRWDYPQETETSVGKAFRTLKFQIISLEGSQSEIFSMLNKEFGIEASLSIPVLREGTSLPWGILSVTVLERSSLTNTTVPLLEELSCKIAMAFSRHEEQSQIRLQKTAMNAVPTPMFITDHLGRFEWANPAFLLKTEQTLEQIQGTVPRVFLSPPPTHYGLPDIWTTLLEKGAFFGEVVDWTKDGTPYTTETRITPIYAEDGRITHYIAAQNDITDKKLFEETLKQQANYDALTHLPNRSYLKDTLENNIRSSRRNGTSLALCFMDLDGFKPVNDQFGHEIGDRILVEVSNRLLRTVRTGDTVARLGGDEFIILLTDITQDNFVQNFLDRLLESISQPYRINGEEIRLTASIGVTFFPIDNSPAEVLIRHADHAMYQAKESGRNRFIFFSSDSDSLYSPMTETFVESPLSHGDLCLRFQPEADLTTGQISSFSGTALWKQNDGEMVDIKNIPIEFQNKRILQEIGYYSITQALGAAHQLALSGHSLPVSIRIECWHLKDPLFITRLGRIMEEHSRQMRGEIAFDLTDTALLDKDPAFLNILEHCRSLGITLYLHDSTTNPSHHLELLRIWPLDRIKVGASLTSRIVDDPGAFTLFYSIANMARVYRREVSVTGLEDIETVIMVQKVGVRYIQGKIISPPLAIEAVPDFLSDFHYTPNGPKRASPTQEFPFLLAYLDHQRAIRRLVEMVQGGRPFPYTMEQAADPWNCRFGQWYYKSENEQLLGNNPLFQETGVLHERAHALTTRIYQLYFEHRLNDAEALVPIILAVKNRILENLNSIESLIGQE
ncbi:MAG: diguanylate cyclase domain-containing protein [Leptospirales bacterium]